VQVGIDYSSAVHQGAGIGRLTRNVVQALAVLDADAPRLDPPGDEYTLLIQGREIPFPPQTEVPTGSRNVASGIPNPNWREVRTRLNQRWWTRIWHRLQLPLNVEWLIGPVDLFHGPDFVLPPLRSHTRAIVTVHDLSFLHLPHCFEPALLDYLNAAVPRSTRRADWVLADSESTRRDAIELLGVPEQQTSVLYPGVESRFRRIEDARTRDRVRAKYRLPKHFFLSVGTVQPRKNYVRLVEAFAQLEVEDVHLVIVGGRGWLYHALFERIEELGLQARVHLTGYVDDVDLPTIYNLAQVVAQPSLYEGFGIPIVEAMACGIPVVAADNSSLPEAAGNAGLLVDALDSEALAEALSRALSDSDLRRTMIERGLAQAGQFTWQKAAETLHATYQQIGSR
jgi:glycosyltransferase involved in cell wall biosynthesis